ncbi:tyrosine-type recombinase/integrase [Demequina capsici]|uniref:Tyrosine-type recombinase/integrase n=1 Tax=Demequina capsici TaxID=3075620 RepID=A0AA96F8A2_9MICO|nr:tyrosine-type recombinase/integrase [Demequina sp. OYTSA14]WNM25252.1 tyrosine-type recombinase/integrase [Demequina sp. OYTSA14]
MGEGNTPWGTAIEGYLKHLRGIGRSPETVRLRRAQLYRLARDVGRRTPAAVTLTDLEAWFALQSWSNATRRSHRDAVRTFYTWALRRELVTVNPAEDLEAGKPSQPNPRPVPEADYRFAMVIGDERDRLMVRLAGEVGLRRAEVAKVHRRDVVEDLLGWSLVVHGKGGRERVVPIRDDLARLLLRADGYVFPGQIDGHLSPAYVGKRVRALLPAPYSMHKLRTRFGTRAYALSRDIAAVQDMMGHASPATTRYYVAVADEAKRAIVEAL